MASQNISQLRRFVFIRRNSEGTPTIFTLEPDDLGQDTIMSFNIAPRMKTRSSSLGTSETPIPNTFEGLSASVTFLGDTWRIVGLALNKWVKSTYEGADANAGQIIGGEAGADQCAGGEYTQVIAQGICDDGSSVDVEFTRCMISIDDDMELNVNDTSEFTLNLHPIVYNALTHEGDGYPAYTYRLGDKSTTEKLRLNVATGEYVAVSGE